MKTRTLWILLALLPMAGFAQKRIVKNVKQDYYSVVRFDRIATDGRQTVADVLLQYIPGWWIYVNSKAFLQESGGDRMYKLLRVEGFPVDSNCHMPPSGEVAARFYFEPVDPDVEAVDYRQPGDNSGLLQTLGIRLRERNETSSLPEAIRGNWTASDGSNEWVYGLWDRFAIYRNRFWNYKTLEVRGQSARITLEDDGDELSLFIKAGKDGTLYASLDGGPMVRLGREPVRQAMPPDTCIPDAERYRDEVFARRGDALLRGYIDGYTPALNSRTMLVYLSDDIYRRDTPVAVDIRPDGRFETRIPLEYPKTLYCTGKPRMNFEIFVSPGDTLMMFFDLCEIVSAKNLLNRNGEHCTRNRYMGGTGEYNTYRFLVEKTIPNKQTLYDSMKDYMARNDDLGFKAAAMQQLADTRDSLQALFARYRVSERTRGLLYHTLCLSRLQPLLDYEMKKRFSRETHTQDSSGKWTVTPNENYRPLDGTFNDYLTMAVLDNPLIVAMPSFGSYINRIEYGNASGVDISNRHLIDYILSREKELAEAVRDSLMIRRKNERLLWRHDTPDGKLIAYYLDKRIEPAFFALQSRGLERNLSFDFALARYVSSKVRQKLERGEPVEREWLGQLVSEAMPYIKTPYVGRKLLELYATHTRSDDAPAPTTKTKGEMIFDSLTAPYRGNVLFVDFWGTGCAPCRAGMISAKPLVRELKERKIKFLYIASEADSPKSAYRKFIDDNRIEGEHMRISADDWNHLAAQYGIHGIPHTMVIDKKGKVVRNNTGQGPDKQLLLDLEAQ